MSRHFSRYLAIAAVAFVVALVTMLVEALGVDVRIVQALKLAFLAAVFAFFLRQAMQKQRQSDG